MLAICPYCAGVTPVRAHCVGDAVGEEPAQGSRLNESGCGGARSSRIFGARIARCRLARIRIPETDQTLYQKLERRASRAFFGHCPIPFATASILHNGDVLMCVHDWARKEIVGNVGENTLAEVWNGDRMREIRALVAKRNYDSIGACRDCSLIKDGWF